MIKEVNEKEREASLEIAKNLKEWFTEEAIKNMKIDFEVNNLIIELDEKKVRGFLCYCSDNGIIKILWIGIKREHQRKGIGTKLLNFLIIKAKEIGSKSIEVETLTEKENYEPYVLTRNFYKKNGFNKIYLKKAIKQGWDDLDVLERKI